MSPVFQTSAPSTNAPWVTLPKAKTTRTEPRRHAGLPPDAHRGEALAAPTLDPSQHFSISRDWQSGEIAFLKPSDTNRQGGMSCGDAATLVDSGYLPAGATGHPVLILERDGPLHTHALVTTISAYGSGPCDDWRAPWEQPAYRDWNLSDWVSIQGAKECKVPGRTPETLSLRLEKGRTMDKQGQWINVQSAWVVPLTALSPFGSNRAEPIRVVPEDLRTLSKYMGGRSHNYRRCRADARLGHVNPNSTSGNWRRGNAPPTAAVPAVAAPAWTGANWRRGNAPPAAAAAAAAPAWSAGDWRRSNVSWRRDKESVSCTGN